MAVNANRNVVVKMGAHVIPNLDNVSVELAGPVQYVRIDASLVSGVIIVRKYAIVIMVHLVIILLGNVNANRVLLVIG